MEESKKELFGKYLALRILETRVSGFDSKDQPCFATMAMLKALKSRNLKPPSSLEHAILSQDIHRIPPPSLPPPHQNAFNILSISWITASGRRNKLIMYDGMAWRT